MGSITLAGSASKRCESEAALTFETKAAALAGALQLFEGISSSSTFIVESPLSRLASAGFDTFAWPAWGFLPAPAGGTNSSSGGAGLGAGSDLIVSSNFEIASVVSRQLRHPG